MPINHGFESGSRAIFETLETSHSRRVASTTLVDLRRNPRYDTQFPGEAISAKGNRVCVTITNLSESGLRFEGPRQNLATLFPVTSPGGEHQPVTLTVNFAVPASPEQSGDIRVRCKTVYARGAQHGSGQVGVQFTKFDEGRKALTGYIAFREADR